MSDVLASRIDPASAEFATNRRHHEALAARLREEVAKAREGGGAKERARHVAEGEAPRPRADRAAARPRHGLPRDRAARRATGCTTARRPAPGLVTGIGRVSGREVMVVANDATVKGGTYFPVTVKKHLRAQEIALENGLPCVYLVDSGGAFLPLQAEVFPDRDHFGRIFYNQARMSAAGLAQVAAVLGSCTAGGAYVPAMSDETVIVKNQGTIFLAGPPLVKAATGETVTAEELGGGDVHTRLSGVADHLAERRRGRLEKVREIVARLEHGEARARATSPPRRSPLYPAEEIYGVLPADLRRPYDVREVLARLLDGSRLHEFKPRYGDDARHRLRADRRASRWRSSRTTASSSRSRRSRRRTSSRWPASGGIPLLFLQNITGFMVGQGRRARAGSRRTARRWSTPSRTPHVPKLTVLVGGSFGAGNYGMCGRAYQPRFLWSWPNARISVMGGEQAADVLATVKDEQRERRGAPAG